MIGPGLKPSGRREVLAGLGAAACSAVGGRPAGAQEPSFRRIRPGEPGWPDAGAWVGLGRAVGGRLAPVTLPELDPADAPRLLANPFFLRDSQG